MSVARAAAARRSPRAARLLGAVVLATGLGFACAGAPALVALSRAQELVAHGRGSEPVCSFRARTGRPCLGCGGTTALQLAARGDLVGALRSNPLGAWGWLAAWLTACAGAASLVTGSSAWLKRAAWIVAASAPPAFVFAVVWWWRSLPPGPAGP